MKTFSVFSLCLISNMLTCLLLLKNPETEPERENMFLNQNCELKDAKQLC